HRDDDTPHAGDARRCGSGVRLGLCEARLGPADARDRGCDGDLVVFRGTGNTGADIQLELEQQGPKVKGHLRKIGAPISAFPQFGGALDGTVSGDVFTFTLTNGSAEGKTSVSGDEKTGAIDMLRKQPMYLRRTSSSPPGPASQP